MHLRTKTIIIYGLGYKGAYTYLLNVPSVSSPYFNKINTADNQQRVKCEVLECVHIIDLDLSAL